MVVSGINDGANLGDDVLYSGTVAAAIEGRFLGLSTIAISLVVRDGRSLRHGGTRGSRARDAADAHAAARVDDPQRQRARPALYEQLRGFKATRLG